jgi:hypothetical protein
MDRYLRTSVGCCALVIFLSLGAAAEELTLKDGTKVTGKVTAVTGDTFQVKTAYGDIQIPREQILTISFPENERKADNSTAPKAEIRPIDETLEGTNYTNRTGHFRMLFPPGWILYPEMRAQAKDIVAALESGDRTLFLLVTPEKFGGTLTTYEVLAETQYQMKFKDYEKLSQTESEVDGKKAIKLVWHAKNPAANNAAIKSVVYIVPYDGRMVRITCLTLEPLFDGALPIFEKIAASYRATDTPSAQNAPSASK